jgi:hypothetical protein
MSTPLPKGSTFLYLLCGAMALRVATYEEVEVDRGATSQALVTVVLSSLAGGLGARGFGASSLPWTSLP